MKTLELTDNEIKYLHRLLKLEHQVIQKHFVSIPDRLVKSCTLITEILKKINEITHNEFEEKSDIGT